MELQLFQVQKICNLIFDSLRKDGLEKVDVTVDFYWWIFPEHLYDVRLNPDPKKFGIGQISEDWEFLTNRNEDEYYFLPDLVKMSDLLRAIAECQLGNVPEI